MSDFSPVGRHVLELFLSYKGCLAPKPGPLYGTQCEDRSPANCCSKRPGGVGQKHKKATSVWTDFHSTDLCCLWNLREQ